jgi:hypothetical protein
MGRMLAAGMMAVMLSAALPAVAAEEFKILLADTFESVIRGQTGKKLTLKLRSGQEVAGQVMVVTGRIVHLKAIAGREFFDAVVPIDAIEAVLVRTKD